MGQKNSFQANYDIDIIDDGTNLIQKYDQVLIFIVKYFKCLK